jgi:plastocyanin
MHRSRATAAVVTTLVVLAATAQVAAAAGPPVAELRGITPLGSSKVRYHYAYGPISVTPGQNLILVGPVTIEKPAYDGYMTRFKPDLVRADGSVPRVDLIHLHHGVFLNLSRNDLTYGGPERIGGTGEEKTIAEAPEGYGYFVRGSDVWAMNHMIHNLTVQTESVWITYDVDYVPANSSLGRTMKAVVPIWMDVQNGSAYPVFDVHRGSGGRDGRFTYPNEAGNPYGRGRVKNEWTVPRNGVLVATAGHVHPGGLWTDLEVVRGGRSKRIFRSEAKYFDPNGPVSWDLSMTRSKQNWRVALRKGDKLRISTTYESKRASWYEAMGINLSGFVPGGKGGNDPFDQRQARRISTRGYVTHGHLPENDNHGGQNSGTVDPRSLKDGTTLDQRVGIAGFQYLPGNQGLPAPFGLPPAVKAGKALSFHNLDWATAGMLHTVTACRAPCNRSTGISYPLANADVDFDSGDLGYGPTGLTAAANRATWVTPRNLRPGTYTYFCRIHPFMRGAFRVVQ